MPNLFSYGTLQYEAVQLSTFGRPLKGVADALPGYRIIPCKSKIKNVIDLCGEETHKIVAPRDEQSVSLLVVLYDIIDDDLFHAVTYLCGNY